MTFPNCFCTLCVHCCGFGSIISEDGQEPGKDVLRCLTPKMAGEGSILSWSPTAARKPPQPGEAGAEPSAVRSRDQQSNTAPISGGHGPNRPLWYLQAAPGATNPAAAHQDGSVGRLPFVKHRNPPPLPGLPLRLSPGHWKHSARLPGPKRTTSNTSCQFGCFLSEGRVARRPPASPFSMTSPLFTQLLLSSVPSMDVLPSA